MGLENLHHPFKKVNLAKRRIAKMITSNFFTVDKQLKQVWRRQRREADEGQGTTALAEKVKNWMLRIFFVEKRIRDLVEGQVADCYEDARLQCIVEVAR